MKTNIPSLYTQKMEKEKERCFSFRRKGGENKYLYEDLAKMVFTENRIQSMKTLLGVTSAESYYTIGMIDNPSQKRI